MKRHFYLLTILLLLFTAFNASASHVYGGSMSYTNEGLGVDTYTIYLKKYISCGSIAVPNMVTVSLSSSCANYSIWLGKTDSVDITPVCSSMPSTSCNNPAGSNPPSIKLITYSATVYLGGNTCNEFKFTYSECCRNSAISNLNNPGSSSLNLSTSVRTGAPNNTGPFIEPIVYYGFENEPVTINFGNKRNNGDSVFYELIPSHNASYLPGFSYTDPVSTQSSVNFNERTGLLSFIPDQMQFPIIAVKASTYRSGVKIGESIFDMPFIILSSNNNYPTVTGIDSTSTDTIEVYADSLLEFNIYASQSSQNLDLTYMDSIPGASFTVSKPAINIAEGKFSWTPAISDVQNYPHYFTVKIEDDLCQLKGFTFKNYYIIVKDPNSPVWPGDANDDLIANNMDLLTVGLAYGATGPVRPNASINWTAQPAPLWSTFLANNLNAKYADTNGDGVVNAADTLAIIQNYGLTHNRIGAVGGANGPVLYIDLPDSVSVGQTVMAPIYLGDTTLPVDSIYGIAFTVTYDKDLVEPNTTSIAFMPSWMGTTGVSTISLKKDFHSSGFIDAAVTRIDQNNVNGFGQIGTLSYVVPDDIAGKTTLKTETMQLLITNIYAITTSGGSIDISGSTDSVVVHEAASMVINKPLNNIRVYPNPVSEYVIVDLGSLEAENITLMDITGRQILHFDETKSGKLELQLSGLLSGIYILQVKTAIGTSSYKIHKP